MRKIGFVAVRKKRRKKRLQEKNPRAHNSY
jgi:hypothetical protein